MRLLRYLLDIIIVGFWVVMMGLLAVREFLPSRISPSEIKFPEKLPYIQNWGIYVNTKRIGSSKVELKKEGDGYIWNGISEFKVSIAQFDPLPISIKSSALFDERAGLKDFDIEMLCYDFAIDIEGDVINNTLNLLYKTDGSSANYVIPWQGEGDIINNGLFPWFYKTGLKTGQRFQWMVFNPLTQKKELVKAQVQRLTMDYQRDNFINVFIVAVWHQNTKMEFWIDENGNPLKINTPWGWEFRAE